MRQTSSKVKSSSENPLGRDWLTGSQSRQTGSSFPQHWLFLPLSPRGSHWVALWGPWCTPNTYFRQWILRCSPMRGPGGLSLRDKVQRPQVLERQQHLHSTKMENYLKAFYWIVQLTLTHLKAYLPMWYHHRLSFCWNQYIPIWQSHKLNCPTL